MKFKRMLISSLLALSFVLSSCGLIIINDNDSKNPTQVTIAPDTAKVPESGDASPNTAEANTEDGGDVSHPENAADRAKKRVAALQNDDFSGQSFIIATSSEMTFATDGESYYDRALLLRDSIVEEKYNIDIINVYVDDRTIEQEMVNSSLAGDYYADLLSVPEFRIGSLAAKGLIMNLRSLPFYGTVDSYSKNYSAAYAGSSIYADIGAASTDFSKIYAVFFNRSAAESLGHDIDKMVEDGEWTWDTFDKLARLAGERLGMVGQGSYAMGDEYTDIVFRSANIKLVDNTLGKTPTVSFDSARLEDAVEQACALIYGNPSSYKPMAGATILDFYSLFGEGKLLFALAPLSAMEILSSSSVKWGIAPIPKMDEKQNGYYAYTEASASVIAVPSENNKPLMTGLVIGALNTASYELLEEEYKTHCLYNYFSSSKALRSMDAVLESITFDFTYLYSSAADLLASATHGAVREARKSKSDYATDLINGRKEEADEQLSVLFGNIEFPEDEYPIPPFETEEPVETEEPIESEFEETTALPETEEIKDTEKSELE